MSILNDAMNYIADYMPAVRYYGSIGNILSSTTWTAPADGIAFINANACTGGGTSYWYIGDQTDGLTNPPIACISMDKNGTANSTMFPVIKGHAYYTTAISGIAYANCYFFENVGVAG